MAAVDRYTDIPEPVRAALKKRMAARQYDEVAAIRRDSIEGRYSYSNLRDMHFGQSQVCRSVTRDKWAAEAVERGLVYCESGHCLIVPTVCRNVSRVTRGPAAAAPPAAAAAGPGAAGEPAVAAAPQDELLFDPPGAGPAPVAGPAAGAGPGLPQGSGPAAPSFVSLAGIDPGYGLAQPMMVASVPLGGGYGGPPVSNPPRRRGDSNLPQPGDVPSPSPPPPPWPAPPQMAPVPEPGTNALIVLGLGLVIVSARRRQPAPAPAR